MGKQLLLNALKNKNSEDRTPWVPFVGVHGGKLIGVTADDYLKSSELIVKGIEESIKKYNPDGIPIAFDLQIEAEALGCELTWSKDNPPAVTSHILDDKKLEDLSIPDKNSARIPIVLEAARKLKAKNYDVALYGLVIGPFTLALHLKGTNIFLEMYDSPDEIKKLMEFCNSVSKKMASMYIDAGCDVIAIVDPMTSQISPEAFVEFVSPYATDFFDELRELNIPSSFFVCGHAQKNIEAMCETKPDNISIDENIPLDYVKDICEKNNISFGGNLKLTVVLLMGTADDCRRNTMECLEVGAGKGYILAPGCDLPYDVPPENLEAIAELVIDPYKRDIAKELLKNKTVMTSSINLSDYGHSNKVIVDVITLDSQSCAPCQYMVEAVKVATDHFGDLVIWREHAIKQKESVEFMMSLMVKNIPTICIDGMIKFVSIIPSHTDLINAIQDRINEKMHQYLTQKQNRILVFGSGCKSCEDLYDNVVQANKELGSTVEVVKIEDEEEFIKHGISSTPAVAVEKTQIKSMGKVPSVDVIKEWIKELQ
ncbi:MAG: uroporphyrinogen decarboxylase [bacterium]|nr:uroporphyrinogen decarboxylase [bacterium]